MSTRKLTNYDGTEASAKAHDIWDTVELLRNTTIPWVKKNTEGEDRLKRIKALKEYERKLLYDFGEETGSDNAWENVW